MYIWIQRMRNTMYQIPVNLNKHHHEFLFEFTEHTICKLLQWSTLDRVTIRRFTLIFLASFCRKGHDGLIREFWNWSRPSTGRTRNLSRLSARRYERPMGVRLGMDNPSSLKLSPSSFGPRLWCSMLLLTLRMRNPSPRAMVDFFRRLLLPRERRTREHILESVTQAPSPTWCSTALASSSTPNDLKCVSPLIHQNSHYIAASSPASSPA